MKYVSNNIYTCAWEIHNVYFNGDSTGPQMLEDHFPALVEKNPELKFDLSVGNTYGSHTLSLAGLQRHCLRVERREGENQYS